MLSDDEAPAVLLGLVAGCRAGLTTAEHTASETASAKIPAGTAQGDLDGPQAGNGSRPLAIGWNSAS